MDYDEFIQSVLDVSEIFVRCLKCDFSPSYKHGRLLTTRLRQDSVDKDPNITEEDHIGGEVVTEKPDEAMLDVSISEDRIERLSSRLLQLQNESIQLEQDLQRLREALSEDSYIAGDQDDSESKVSDENSEVERCTGIIVEQIPSSWNRGASNKVDCISNSNVSKNYLVHFCNFGCSIEVSQHCSGTVLLARLCQSDPNESDPFESCPQVKEDLEMILRDFNSSEDYQINELIIEIWNYLYKLGYSKINSNAS